MAKLKPTDFLDMDLYKIIPKLMSYEKDESSRVWKEASDTVSESLSNYGKKGREQAQILDALARNPKDIKKIDPLLLGMVLVEYVAIALEEWTRASTQRSADLMIQSLPLFVEMSATIPEVNPKNQYKTAFRGTDIRQKQLHPFIKKSKLSDWKQINIAGTTFMAYNGPLKNGFVYKPHRAVQSWSVSSDAAAGFAGTVIAVPIDTSFFFDPKFTGQFGYGHEKETIHYGKKPMRVLLSIDKEDFDDLRSRDRVNEVDTDIKESNEIPDKEGTLIIPGI